MSEAFSRFVSLAVPDVAEGVGRVYLQHPDDANPPTSGMSGRPRKPRNSAIGAPPALGKQESFVNTITNPKPDDIQLILDQALTKFIDAHERPEKRAEVMIKLGQYQVELSKYAPMLRDADQETAEATLGQWFDDGDAELKKALVNAMSGAEDFPLAKVAVPEGPEAVLAKMVDEARDDRERVDLVQKMGFYSTQLHEMIERGAMLKIDQATIDEAIVAWIADGDGSHRDLKKAVADAESAARGTAGKRVGENEVLDEKPGNAPSHVSSKMSGTNDRTYAPRSTEEGAGPRMRGSKPAPGQATDDHVDVSSGPDDLGGKGITPQTKIRRKGATGGLGSVTGEKRGDTAQVSEPSGFKSDKGSNMDKNADLALELIKIAPVAMIQALGKMDQDAQVETCQAAAQDAADLMAWSSQNPPDTLQKSALDSRIADWLSADPQTVQMKKWTAEALASAGEIPLELGKAIMGWTLPAAAAPAAAAATKPRMQLRQPYSARAN